MFNRVQFIYARPVVCSEFLYCDSKMKITTLVSFVSFSETCDLHVVFYRHFDVKQIRLSSG